MEKARESRAENSEGITVWQVAEHEDWLDVKQEDGDNDVDKEEGNMADPNSGSSIHDVNAALDRFRSAHKDVEVSLNEESRTVTVRHLYILRRVIAKIRKLDLPPPAQISFQIQLNTTTEGQNSYGIDSKSKSRFHEAIIKAIRAGPRTEDLTYLLVGLKLMSTFHTVLIRFSRKCWLRTSTSNQNRA